jgi:Ca2+-binding EF-hand superfamily protein
LLLRLKSKYCQRESIRIIHDTVGPRNKLGELNDFLNCIYQVSQKDDSAIAIKNAFSAFDKDETGYLGVAELQHVLKSFGEPLNDNELQAFMSNFTILANDTIPMAEVIKVLDFTPNYKAL